MRSILYAFWICVLATACEAIEQGGSGDGGGDGGALSDAPNRMETPTGPEEKPPVTDAEMDEPPNGNQAGGRGSEPEEEPSPDDPNGDPNDDSGWYGFDESRCGERVYIDETRVQMERTAIASEACGSAVGIGAGEGVFYAEFERLVDIGGAAFGVGPEEMPREGTVGMWPNSVALWDNGSIAHEGQILPARFDPSGTFYGVIVDRRERDPTIHLIAGEGEIVGSFELADFPGSVYLYASGPRFTLGAQVRINAGEDRRTRPFAHDARGALRAIDESGADVLVLGLRDRPLLPMDEPPLITIEGPDEVARFDTIPLVIEGHDPEDGNLSAEVVVEDDAFVYSSRRIALEAGQRYRGTLVGVHRLRAYVRDSRGQLGEAFHSVRVVGEIERPEAPRLVGVDGDGAIISDDGLGVRFTSAEKVGVRANLPIYGELRYFEVHHLGPSGNFGAGIVAAEGSLLPYALRNVPASTSLNLISGVWRNLVYFASYPEDEPRGVVGIAVDFRGDFPTVHYILNHRRVASVPVPNLTTPAHPFVYGTMTEGSGPQLRINLGDEPFVYDVEEVLAAAADPG